MANSKRYVKREPKTAKKLVTERHLHKYVKKQINKDVESKYSQTNVSLTNVTSSGFVTDLCLVPQGDTDNNRDGDQLYAYGLQVNYQFIFNSAFGAGFTQLVRIVVFQWFPAGATNISNIFNNTNIPTQTSPLSYFNWDNRQMYKILYDKMHELNTYQNPAIVRHLMLKKFKFKKLQYNSGTTAGTNHIYISAISDDTTGNYPLLSYQTRLMYTDS